MKNIKIEFKWAIIFTIMSMLWILLESITGLHDEYIEYHPIYTNLYAIPAILVYVLALRDKKYNFFNGQISFKQIFISGLVLSLIIALFAPLSTFVSVEYLSPDFFDNAISKSVELEMMTQVEANEYFNTSSYMLQSLMFAPIFGIITTLVVGIFLRSKSK
jgi:hypothetical protein